MKCIVCQGEDIHLSEVKEELKIGNDIIYTPIRIPACRSCGERYYDRRTVRYLEEVEQELAEGTAPLHEVGKVMELAG